MRHLPIDARGYPVPWFVQWVDGAPDFRIMDRAKWARALRFGNCWLCGDPCGKQRTFVIGPMCAINRTTSEPGCHYDCAEFAALACPFMTLPAAQYRSANLPPNTQTPGGVAITRNPGVTCLWSTIEWSVFRATVGAPGQLIHLGEPREVRWFARARAATRDEVEDSIRGGFPLLEEAARAQGLNSVATLHSMRAAFSRWLPG